MASESLTTYNILYYKTNMYRLGEVAVQKIVEPTNFLLRELEQRNSVGGESSYGLNGHVIPAERQQLPDFGFVIDIILNVSHISDRDSTSPEEMDYASDSSCMERDDDVMCRLAGVMYSKPLSGIHRYISSVIVPGGVDGVQRCLYEVDQLIRNTRLYIGTLLPVTTTTCTLATSEVRKSYLPMFVDQSIGFLDQIRTKSTS
ncbi:hypothetical protein QTP88_008841 [Uroleucon formosanum]